MDLIELRWLLEYWEEQPPTHEVVYAAWFKKQPKRSKPRTREQLRHAIQNTVGARVGYKPRKRFNPIEPSGEKKPPKQFNPV